MANTEERLSDLHRQLSVHLEQGIIPFWLARACDNEYGGFLTNFDGEGRPLDTPEKYLNTQARLIWWFSTLYRHYPAQTRARELASYGVDFLLKYFWDMDVGGWYWKVRRDGSVLTDAKLVYGQSFAIYALGEYYRATGDPRGLQYATATFELLQRHCADKDHGGYYENLVRDWTLAPPGFAAGDRKSLDTHMHLIESFTTLYAASGSEQHRNALLDVVDLVLARMIDHGTGCGRNQFNTAFQPIPAIAIRHTWNAEREGDAPDTPTDTTSYGHNTELSWLVRQAITTASADFCPYKDLTYRLVDHAAKHGVDWEHGGIYRDGLAHGEVVIQEKEFWQNAESLVGFLDAFEASGEIRFLEAFEQVWRFVDGHMINHEVGEWHTLLGRDGKLLDPRLGNPWKVAYHTGRSMLECTRRLAQLLERMPNTERATPDWA